MSAGQVHAARLNPAKFIETRLAHSPDWFLDWAFEEAQRLGEGRGHYVLTARTTVDLGMQKAATEAMINTLRYTGPTRKRGYTGAMVSMEPDGAVRAMVGGMDYEDNQFNRATHARRQPGSSFKLYVYATAFENGGNPRSIVRDFGGACGNWAPEKLQRRRRLGPVHAGHRRLPHVPQRARRRGVAAGRPREGSGDDPAPRRRRRQEDLLDGARRYRHHAAAAHRRLRHVRQRRQARQALRHPRDVQLQGRPHLLARQGRARGPAGREPQGRRGHEPDDARGRDGRHGQGRRPRLHRRRRQDRHQLQLSRRLVRRLHGRARHRACGSATTTSAPWPASPAARCPSQAWHRPTTWSPHQNYRTIPPIPGLGLDANQIAEQQRLQDLRRTDPALAQAQIAQAAQKPSSSIMPDQTKVVLKKLSESLRQAAGLQPTPASAAPATAPAAPKGPPPPEQKAKPSVGAPERRAEGPGAAPSQRP